MWSLKVLEKSPDLVFRMEWKPCIVVTVIDFFGDLVLGHEGCSEVGIKMSLLML